LPMLSAFAAFGVWPALPLTGYWLFTRVYRESGSGEYPLVRSVALMAVAGTAVWSLPMLGSAMIGIYRAEIFGLLGWMVTLRALFGFLKRREISADVRLSLAGLNWTLVVGLTVAAGLYMGFPHENIYGGRDEGVYAIHGMYIAHHGRLDVPYPWPESLSQIFPPGMRLYPGFYPTHPTMTVQFAHLFPVWLAQCFAALGEWGLFRLNGLYTLLFLVIFYGVCRLALLRSTAAAATIFLALNPSEIWMARNSLSENLTQLFIWSGLYMLLTGLKSGHKVLMRWAGVFLGLSALVRIDGLLMVPLVFLSHLAYKIVEAPMPETSATPWRCFYETALPTFVLAVGYYVLFSPVYFAELSPRLKILGVISLIALVALLAATPGIVRKLGPWLTSRAVLIALGLVLLLLTIDAYWLRPHWLSAQHVIAAGDYRMNSLVNLAEYLSPPVILVAVVGWYVSLWTVVRERRDLHLIVALMVVAGCSVLYLWNPQISPDHFWAIRRFIPVVIPGFVFFAALGVHWLLARLPQRRAIAVSQLALVFLAVFTIRTDAMILTLAENRGYFHQVKHLADKLPRDEIVLAHGDTSWVTPLYVAFDRKVIPIDLESDHGQNILEHWIAGQSAERKPIYLLSEARWRFSGLQKTRVDGVTLSRSYSERTVKPLPKKIETQQRLISLYRIAGGSHTADYRDVPLGAEMAWGVKESGFNHQEWRGNIPVRWTNGAAHLAVPLGEQHPPRALRVDLDSPLPNGTHLRVLINDRELFSGHLPPRFWSKTFSLSSLRLGKRADIKLLSDSFVPSQVMASSDTRRLGVLVSLITLLKSDKALSAASPSREGYKSQVNFTVSVGEGQTIPLKVTVRNRGRDPWPVVPDPGQQKGRVNLGILWFAEGQPGRRLAEHRAELPYTMFHNDEVEIDVALNPIGYDGKRLPPGSYEVWIGPVQEGVTWFYEKGDEPLKLAVEVKP